MLSGAYIDAQKFAREAESLAGELPVAEMVRLHDVLWEPSGTVGYELRGSIDGRGKPVLDVTVRGVLLLVCQRCLERLDFDLLRRSRLLIAPDPGALPDVAAEDPDHETVAAADVADVADLVEQEVLLGLPIAPMHATECRPAAAAREPGASSPFAVLQSLKRG